MEFIRASLRLIVVVFIFTVALPLTLVGMVLRYLFFGFEVGWNEMSHQLAKITGSKEVR